MPDWAVLHKNRWPNNLVRASSSFPTSMPCSSLTSNSFLIRSYKFGATMKLIRTYLSTLHRKGQIRPLNLFIKARVLVPADLEQPSLAQLPEEVLLLILSFINDKNDFRTIAAVSSTFYQKARRIQSHTVHVDLGKSQRSQARSRFDVLERNLLFPAVRVLKVRANSSPIEEAGEEDAEGHEILTRLANMLPYMAGLRDLHWLMPSHTYRDWLGQMPAPIPRIVLNSIPPQTNLHTAIAVKDEPLDRLRAFLAQLVDNKNLFSLSVHIAFVNDQECSATLRILKQILLSCPRLVRIPLLFVGQPSRPPHGRADSPDFGAPYCGLGLSRGERPPPLEELGLMEYPWGYERTAAFRPRYSLGYSEKGNEIQY